LVSALSLENRADFTRKEFILNHQSITNWRGIRLSSLDLSGLFLVNLNFTKAIIANSNKKEKKKKTQRNK